MACYRVREDVDEKSVASPSDDLLPHRARRCATAPLLRYAYRQNVINAEVSKVSVYGAWPIVF
jgi:hypothetical protein